MTKGKGGKIIIAAAAVVVIVVVILAIVSRFTSAPSAPEVISKRVKIEPFAAAPAQPQAQPVAPAAPEKAAPATVQPQTPTATAKPPETKPLPVRPDLATVKPAAPQPAPTAVPPQAAQKSAPAKSEPVKTAKAKPKEPPKKKAEQAANNNKKKTAKEQPVSSQWVVGVASFRNLADARATVATLKASRYKAYITEYKDKGATWHRVRVGFYKSEGDARKAAKALTIEFGFAKPWVVRATKEEVSRNPR